MKNSSKIIAVLCVCLACISVVSAERVGPTFTEGNTKCEDIGCFGPALNTGVPNPLIGISSYTNVTDGFSVTINIHSPGDIDWSSNYPVNAVIVKDGGLYTNVYKYTPAVTSDTGLIAPLNPAGQSGDVSHLVFCYIPGTNPPPPVPEFPSLALPLVMMSGMIGLIYIVKQREK